MKYLILLLSLLALVGCGEDNDNDDNQQGGDTPIVKPDQWGKLRCQRAKSCDNIVLNLEFKELSDFVALQFPEDKSLSGGEAEKSFHCGTHFMKIWMATFPQHAGAGYWELHHIAEFGRKVMNIKKCTNQPDVSKSMNTYLTHTKDYQNAN